MVHPLWSAFLSLSSSFGVYPSIFAAEGCARSVFLQTTVLSPFSADIWSPPYLSHVTSVEKDVGQCREYEYVFLKQIQLRAGLL